MSMNDHIPVVFSGLVMLMATGCGRAPVPQTTDISTPVDQVAVNTSRLPAPFYNSHDWPGWRGPRRDNVVVASTAPTEWSVSKNVVWKSRLPGHGHASPVILGQRIFLATADNADQLQSVLAIDRDSGRWIWQTDILKGQFESTTHPENSQASSTIASDGERLFAAFLNDRRIWCSAVSLEGEELWRQEVGGFRSRFGYSASPVVYQSVVIIAADHEDGGFLAALDRETGNIVWRRKRPAAASYASPGILQRADADLVILSGGNQVTAYDPKSGVQVWTVSAGTESMVGTPVFTEGLIIISGGHPGAETVALDHQGQVVWKTKDKCYVTTPVAASGLLFLMQDDGIIKCLKTRSGQELWKHRIGGKFRASPLMINDHIYVTDMAGKTTVFKASAARFELIAENQLGTECFASPAVSEGQLLIRIADDSRGVREEWLYCLQDDSPSREIPANVSQP